MERANINMYGIKRGCNADCHQRWIRQNNFNPVLSIGGSFVTDKSMAKRGTHRT